MDDLNLTLTTHTAAYDWLGLTPDASGRLVSGLQRATFAEVEQALARKGVVGLEAEILLAMHATLHGDRGAAERWLMEAPDYECLSERARALAGLLDAVEEACGEEGEPLAA